MEGIPLRIRDLAEATGRGLLAGAVGTAVMTVSSTLEAKLRDRGPSSAPADAAGKVLGIQPRDSAGQARFSSVVHWSYGTSWGAVRGIIGLSGLGPVGAATAHFATVWGSSLVMLPALGVAPPIWQSPPAEVATDAFHHAVYAAASGCAYTAISA
ncbi:MAG: hypothetical protein H0U33_08140 [Solirubrobacterales bacterium]|jgi:hypothetical protein|nr:hypothetical protein [Solirubrobacterales bacterium]